MSRWIHLETDADLDLMSDTLGISKITSRILANRGVRSRNAAIRFLRPDRRYMYKAALLKDMGRAVSIVNAAIKNRKKIVIYGDYDVDGVSSTVILMKTLSLLSVNVSYYIPRREEEGYGMNPAAVRQLAESGTNLIIACDNGISAMDEVKLANSLGMEVVIIDHHEPGNTLPPAAAIIDHKQTDCQYPFKKLCAASLCYKFTGELAASFDIVLPEQLDKELLIFAAMATICDIVALLDENRIIAVNGLDALSSGTSNAGLNALLADRGLAGKRLNVHDIGFIIGPCINAAGRLESAGTAAELFLTDDNNKAISLAVKLSVLNEARRTLTDASAERLIKAVSENVYGDKKVFVIHDPGTPESVAGIVAGRVKEAACHPVIILSDAMESGLVKGSARSIDGYNIFEGLSACKDLFERFGGHEMAAGLTMKLENLSELDRRLNEDCNLCGNDFDKVFYIDSPLEPERVTFSLANEIIKLGPFGKDCREPLFASYNVHCDSVERIGTDGKTLRFTFNRGHGKLRGIAFGAYDSYSPILLSAACRDDGWTDRRPITGLTMDIAYNIGVNEYNGERSLQIFVKDIKNLCS